MPIPPADGAWRLAVRFAEQVALVECADELPCRRLAALLRHCRPEGASLLGPPAVTFRLEADRTPEYRLIKDGVLMCEGLAAQDVPERVIYELTLALATVNQERLVFHAAGLVRGEHGVVLCGESGCGKSTLAMRLTAEGFDFLSDELVAIAPASGDSGNEVLGFARPIGLKAGGAAVGSGVLAEIVRTSGLRLPSGTVYLDPEHLRPGCVRDRARAKTLVFPEYSATARSGLRPLSRAEATFRLMHRLLNWVSWPDRGFAATARLAGQLPAYSLTYADSGEAVAWVEQAMAHH